MPDSGSLEALARQLLSRGPPAVSALLNLLSPAEDFPEFMALIQEYLPDHQADILVGFDVGEHLSLFAQHFRNAYFPLPYLEDAYAGDEFGYGDLTYGVPVYFSGIDWDDWHEMPHQNSLGRRLMMSLIASPWAVGDEGMRVALMESCLSEIPAELLQRVPPAGYPPSDLHQWLDGSAFAGEATLGTVVWHDTGTTFIDADQEDYLVFEWSMEQVQALTREWLRSEQIYQEIHALEEWLDTDSVVRYRQMLDFIDERKEQLSSSPGENTPLIDVFAPET